MAATQSPTREQTSDPIRPSENSPKIREAQQELQDGDNDHKKGFGWWQQWWFIFLLAIVTQIAIIVCFILLALSFFQSKTIVGENPIFNAIRYAVNPVGSLVADCVASYCRLNQQAKDCPELSQVPQAYRQWVKEAADRWLHGDQAALIALISTESGWDRRAAPPAQYNSTAAGLGQFLTSTAQGRPEFAGGSDGTETWSAGQINQWAVGQQHNPKYANDARYDPRRAIFAAAHYFSGPYNEYHGNITNAYAYGYHRGANSKNPNLRNAAFTAGNRLNQKYLRIMRDCFKTTAPVTGTTTTSNGPKVSYTAPLEPEVLRNYLAAHGGEFKPYNGDPNANAVAIDVPNSTPVSALASGTVLNTFYFPQNTYPGFNKPNGCGSGVAIMGDDGVRYTYCNMGGVNSNIQKGQRISAGQGLGVSGKSGNAATPQLQITAQGLTGQQLRDALKGTVQ